MAKFIGWLKRAKQKLGKGISWINKNIVKPILPAARSVLDATGFGTVGKLIEGGSNFLENVLDKEGYKSKDQIGKYVKDGSEFLLRQLKPDLSSVRPKDSGSYTAVRNNSGFKEAVPSERRQLKFQDSTPTQLKTGKFKKLF